MIYLPKGTQEWNIELSRSYMSSLSGTCFVEPVCCDLISQLERGTGLSPPRAHQIQWVLCQPWDSLSKMRELKAFRILGPGVTPTEF